MNQNTMWTVIDKKTGKRICDCAEETDAIMMVKLGINQRTYHKNQFILDQIIDIPHQKIKELPGQLGLPPEKLKLNDSKDIPFKPY